MASAEEKRSEVASAANSGSSSRDVTLGASSMTYLGQGRLDSGIRSSMQESSWAGSLRNTLGPDHSSREKSGGGYHLSNWEASIGLGTTSYLGQGTLQRDSTYSTFGLEVLTANQTPLLDLKGQLQLMVSANHSHYNFVEIPEAYVGLSPQFSPVQLGVGRRLENWSQLDETWGLGIWQPRFRWDYIDPQPVGLAGAFLTVQQPNLRIVLMGSPFFVPDRGAPADFAEGRIQSQSPWLVNLPYTVNLFNQPTPIRYTAEIPNTMDVVTHKIVLSGLVRAGSEKGPWGSVAYAYKPMNQFITSYEAYHNNGTSEVEATIYPHFEYHSLSSVQGGFNSARTESSLSLLTDSPDLRAQDPRLTTQELRTSLAVSPSFAVRLRGEGREATTADISYLKQWGGDAPDSGRLASGASSFESRYPFKNAGRLGLKSSLSPLFGKSAGNFYGSVKTLVDLKNPGNILSTQLAYRPRQSWSLMMGADLITSFSELPENPSSPDFISRYRANDRVYGGLNYAF
ncbi:MAG: hypothetical protein H7222_06875 [Methylotenera sp.]|nr:hypothetical protein [Oligoflexia bacterium]